MKRLFALLLAAIMLFSLTSCDLESILTGGNEGVTMDYDYEKMEENLKKMREEDGIYIEMSIVNIETGETPTAEKIIYAETPTAFFYCGDGDELIVDFSDDTKAVTYTKQEDGKWLMTETVYEEAGITREQMEESCSYYTIALFGYLGNYKMFEGAPMKKTSEKVAGRECDQFSYSIGLFGYGMEYTFCIDIETGMCLSWKLGASAGAEGSGSTEFTCKKFETPYKIDIPSGADIVTSEKEGAEEEWQGK